VSLAARAYIACTALAGLLLLSLSIAGWTGVQPVRFLCFLALGVVCSVWKVSLPGVTSTLSVNYIFVLIAASACDFPQTLLIATVGATAQSIFRAKARPQIVHLLFNASSAVVTSACCYAAYHFASRAKIDSTPLLLLMTASAYYLANSASISGVIGLTEHKKFLGVFRESYLWTAPQYLIGATVAAVFSALSYRFGWDWALLIVPVMFVVYGSYRIYLKRLEAERRHVKEVSELHLRTIEALAVAIDAKDETTHDHLQRVQVYALAIAKELGLGEGEMQALQAASLLHDIGKLAVPEYILSKPGRLTPEEFERVKIHPSVGAEILERVHFPYPVVPIVAAHHEKWNGTGYPNGLAGEQIPIGARILSAVDCFDALASDRQYRRALPLDEAMQKIVEQAGTSFDPQVVHVLKRRYRELEKVAHDAHVETTKLSREPKAGRAAVPDAGFVEIAEHSSEDRSRYAVSIANARQEFQAVCELIDALGTSLAMEQALSFIGAYVKALVPCDCIAIYVIDEGMLVPQHVSGTDEALFRSIRIPLGEGVSGWVADTRRTVVNGNPSVEPGYLQNPTKFSILLSVTSIPLIGSAGVVGVLSLYSRSRDSFTADHVRVLNAVAAKAAIAVERVVELRRFRGTAPIGPAPIDPAARIADAGALLQHLEVELSRCSRTGEPLAVLILNLDGLKKVAERRGPIVADALVTKIGEALRHSCREYDLVAHLRTDEFVIALTGADPAAVRQRAGEFVRTAQDTVPAAIGDETLSIVAGTATWPADGTTSETLLAAADRDAYTNRRAFVTSREAAVLPKLWPSDTWNESVVSCP